MSNQESLIREVKVIRSPRRHKTISAYMKGDTMQVFAPYHLKDSCLGEAINNLREKFERKMIKDKSNKEQNLSTVAEFINKKYFSGKLKINSIEYVDNESRKFGCCNYTSRNIRISHRVAHMPSWVRDYVIFHEMAHLIEPNHGVGFWNIVSRYKLAERARGYLVAKSFEAEDEKEIEGT